MQHSEKETCCEWVASTSRLRNPSSSSVGTCCDTATAELLPEPTDNAMTPGGTVAGASPGPVSSTLATVSAPPAGDNASVYIVVARSHWASHPVLSQSKACDTNYAVLKPQQTLNREMFQL